MEGYGDVLAMALQQPFASDSTTYALAYHRVTRVYLDIDAGLVEVVVLIWPTQADRQAGRTPVSGRRFTLTSLADLVPFRLATANALVSAYAWLKQRDTYRGAQDV
jgi:hypothetical protein